MEVNLSNVGTETKNKEGEDFVQHNTNLKEQINAEVIHFIVINYSQHKKSGGNQLEDVGIKGNNNDEANLSIVRTVSHYKEGEDIVQANTNLGKHDTQNNKHSQENLEEDIHVEEVVPITVAQIDGTNDGCSLENTHEHSLDPLNTRWAKNHIVSSEK